MRTARLAAICRIVFADWRTGCSVISATCPASHPRRLFSADCLQVAKGPFPKPRVPEPRLDCADSPPQRAGAYKVRAGQVTVRQMWCGRRDLNPHGPFKPCGFSCRLRLSPPGRGAFGGLRSGLRSGLSLHPPPEASELRCCPSSLYTFPAGVSPGLARDCHFRVPRI